MLFQKPTYDWLIAGLGNPGPEYEKTRHNTGFMSLDLLAARLQVKVSKERFKATFRRWLVMPICRIMPLALASCIAS